tara:strand:+ start:32 stop:721 length:690 start_codon:yes stop_codon:yes gene_type:complete
MKKENIKNSERRILKSQKNVFWEALVIAIFIFGSGILLGVFIENARVERISEMYLKSELNLLDIKIQTEILNLEELDCGAAIEKNIEFGDKVFNDAKTLQKYEDANRFSDSLVEQHKKYDLLRTLFWINSIKIKQKCNTDFNTLVYLYNYNNEEEKEKSKKVVFSRFLEELKEEKGNTILLIPIARDLNLASLDMLVEKFNINQTSIILDEEFIISEVKDLHKIADELN